MCKLFANLGIHFGLGSVPQERSFAIEEKSRKTQEKNSSHWIGLPHTRLGWILFSTSIETDISRLYIQGYAGEEKAFIATQGPMSHTVNDFWRAVWHVKAPVVVMITKLKEKNKVR